MLHSNGGDFVEDFPREVFQRQHKHSTEVHELCCTKLNSDTVASSDYMIHDGDYYKIDDKENVILLLDEIYQRIIWVFQQIFIWHNIILSRSLGQDPYTRMYTEAISGRDDAHVRIYKGQLMKT